MTKTQVLSVVSRVTDADSARGRFRGAKACEARAKVIRIVFFRAAGRGRLAQQKHERAVGPSTVDEGGIAESRVFTRGWEVWNPL